jgi:hypothetical protein
VKHTIAGLCNDLHGLQHYQMARVDVRDFSLSLGIDRHQVATDSFNLVVELSKLCVYPSVIKGYLFRITAVFAAKSTNQRLRSFVVTMPDLLQGCSSHLNQGSPDIVKKISAFGLHGPSNNRVL